MLQGMFKKTYTLIGEVHQAQQARKSPEGEKPNVPEGMWKKCNQCGRPIYAEDVRQQFYICPKCHAYFRVPARKRLEQVLDEGSFVEFEETMPFVNPLDFPGYEKKLESSRERTGLDEAVVTGKGTIEGQPAVIGVCDSRFLMSSMGHNVGEKIALAVERATREKLPVILFACSGGARMQEGLVSLMQMAKTAAALKRHHEAGLLYVSVLTDPTTGGVTASFAMLGDIILAEPGALIGFAGPRVIEQTIGQKLPEGFQRAEFLLEHGFVDRIVKRPQMREELSRILSFHDRAAQKAGSMPVAASPVAPQYAPSAADQPGSGEKRGMQGGPDAAPDAGKEAGPEEKGRSAWDIVTLSRSPKRPVASDYIQALFPDFYELHGDRYFKDDGAVIAGLATFYPKGQQDGTRQEGIPVTVIGQEKGRSAKENQVRNFGMPSPDGYRKALRLMKQAEKFGRPIVCFVDTPGAFCGMEAEERGQGEAIARNLFEMADMKVPVLSILIGEGGSGGALALAVANEVWMMENASYSILSPEGFASILWKDSRLAQKAAEVMKITAADLKEMGLIERVIPEEEPAEKKHVEKIAGHMKEMLGEFLSRYLRLSGEELARQRYERFRSM